MKHLDLTDLNHEAEAAWNGVLDLAEACPEGWALAGGQAVFVQTELRGETPARPSSDADLIIDLRADPGAARRIVAALRQMGFEGTKPDANGVRHRWFRVDAQIDVLQPRYLGDRVEKRLAREGLETIAAPGAQHLLSRTERVEITLGARTMPIRTPTALGIIVAKAAGFQEIVIDPERVRHLADILTVGSLMESEDLENEAAYTRLEAQRVGNAIGKIRLGRYTKELRAWFPEGIDDRLEALARVHRAHSRKPIEARPLGKLEMMAEQAAIAPASETPWDGSWPHAQGGQGRIDPGHGGPSYGM